MIQKSLIGHVLACGVFTQTQGDIFKWILLKLTSDITSRSSIADLEGQRGVLCVRLSDGRELLN